MPCLAIARDLMAIEPHMRTVFISTTHTIDTKLLKKGTLVHNLFRIKLGNVPKRLHLIPWFVFRLGLATIKSFYILIKFRPSKVISTGGYISIPIALSAMTLRIPITLYELNAKPGKTIKFLSKIASEIKVCFESCSQFLPAKKCKPCTYPLWNKTPNTVTSREAATKKLGLPGNKFTVLVTGGSQGSRFINKATKMLFEKFPAMAQSISLIHQTGHIDDAKNFQETYDQLGVTALSTTYLEQMDLAYCSADLIICRAGAGALFEAKNSNKKCIIIPLETAETDHQRHNAIEMAKENPKLFTVIRQKDIEANIKLLLEAINQHIKPVTTA